MAPYKGRMGRHVLLVDVATRVRLLPFAETAFAQQRFIHVYTESTETGIHFSANYKKKKRKSY